MSNRYADTITFRRLNDLRVRWTNYINNANDLLSQEGYEHVEATKCGRDEAILELEAVNKCLHFLAPELFS